MPDPVDEGTQPEKRKRRGRKAPPPPPGTGDTPPPGQGEVPGQAPPPQRSSSPWLLLLILGSVIAVLWYMNRDSRSEISYGFFRKELEAGNIENARLQGLQATGEFKTAPPNPLGKKDRAGNVLSLKKEFATTIPVLARDGLDELLLKRLGPNYGASEPNDSTSVLLAAYVLVPLGLLAVWWFMMRRTRDSIFSGGLLGGFTKSPARRYEQGDRRETFQDVAGLEGVKRELEEIVEFLKNPRKFQRLGGRVPKGILLMGPPGTGKTLLGRAVAGEAGVPFYSVSGSEFIQMFVGVGASRVRDLFATAKEKAPSILFIDEIDAVGRHRGAGVGGGHDEREQTLNQILSEMDGFTQTESVIVMAATNRPDVLDPALLRPGRFDRHITVDRPSLKGRKAIFEVHTREVPLDKNVDLERLAAGTVGLTGADIRNLVNEAALWASRRDKNCVDMADFDYARDKILMGAKREEVLTPQEKVMCAYHESGHTLLAWLVPGIDRVHKVSIIPRGRSLGATHLMPEEDRVSISESELHTRLLYAMGGRAAEKLVFGESGAGVVDDLARATQIARWMVTHWGMSERLGPVAFRDTEEHPFLGREIAQPRQFSEATAQLIDEEVSRILRTAAQKAADMLSQHRDKLDALAHALEQEETLDDAAIEAVIGPPAPRPVKDT
jgi:cell division protease FtsH